jgi:hypothetical protein
MCNLSEVENTKHVCISSPHQTDIIKQRRYFKMEQVDLIIEVNDIHVLVIEGCHGCDHTEVAYHH